MAALEPTQVPGVQSPPGGDPPPTPAPVAAPQPATVATPLPTEDWEKRFKGMQTAYQQKDAELKQVSQNIATLTQERDTQVAQNEALQIQVTERNTALESASTEQDQFNQQMAELQAKTGVQDLILTEYLDLAPVASMIVPTVMAMESEESQREALTGWQDRMSGIIQEQVSTQVQNALRGVTPLTSPARVTSPGMGMTDEQLSARMNQVAGLDEHKQEYQMLYAEWTSRVDAQGE